MHTVLSTPTGAGPWYSHRWPWLLMLGPVVVIIGGSFAAYLAISRPDAMVVDDYYKQGKAINQDLRRDRIAATLRLSFEARYDPAQATLAGSLRSAGMPLATPLHIYLAHPTQPAKDMQLLVQPDAAGRFSVALPMLERAHWQVVVEGQQREWRLARSWSWPSQQYLEIRADALEAGQ
ncbi:MAG: cytochrome oxidase assembly protein [Massilia sp.]|nr:cytochrome oxidase assembly protein [Massilia sp.]